MKCFIQSSALVAACLSLSLMSAPLARAESVAQIDKKAVEKIIGDYLMNNPAVLHKALEKAAAYAEASETEKQQQAVQASRAELFANSNDPVTGNPAAKVNMAYFFDYQCGYCKKMADTNKEFFSKNGPVRVVLKELPILGPASVMAARAALAAQRQGKYDQFHHLMMDMRGPLNQDRIMTLAATIGLDQEQLKKDMADPAIEAELARHRELARGLGINGTPAYVIEDTLIPGAISADDMRKIINDATQKTK